MKKRVLAIGLVCMLTMSTFFAPISGVFAQTSAEENTNTEENLQTQTTEEKTTDENKTAEDGN